MTKRTNVILAGYTTYGPEGRFRHEYPHLRVKLDRNGFPYIVIDNEKHIIGNTNFPRTLAIYDDVIGELTHIVEGADDLATILANPDLTIDKLSLQTLCRVA